MNEIIFALSLCMMMTSIIGIIALVVCIFLKYKKENQGGKDE